MRTKHSADSSTGQVSKSAAEVYEEYFVPALFGQWVEPMLDAVHPAAGERLLDIGSGTGVLARAALARVGIDGEVVAVDPNDGMLAVARRLAPGVEFRQGRAEQLPIESRRIDCVTCQFALMFVTDPQRAIGEMARVMRAGGRVAIATWASIEQSPGYATMADLLNDEVGQWAAASLLAPFSMGTADRLRVLLETAFSEVVVERRVGQACFGSLADFMHTEIRGWTLAERIDDEHFDRLCQRAETALGQFVDADGRVRFEVPALIATATRA